jgi:hypothetical protein
LAREQDDGADPATVVESQANRKSPFENRKFNNAIFVIIAAIKASDGEFYRYPMTIRFIQ